MEMEGGRESQRKPGDSLKRRKSKMEEDQQLEKMKRKGGNVRRGTVKTQSMIERGNLKESDR